MWASQGMTHGSWIWWLYWRGLSTKTRPLQPYVVLGYFPPYGNDSHNYTMLHPLISPTTPVVMAARRAGCGLHELPIVPYVEHAQRTGLPMTTIGAWGPASFDPFRVPGDGDRRNQITALIIAFMNCLPIAPEGAEQMGPTRWSRSTWSTRCSWALHYS